MKPWRVVAMLLGATVLCGGALLAQSGDGEEDYYLDEEIPDEVGAKYALGIGFGFVELGDNVIQGQQIITDDDVEPFFSLGLRIRFGDRHAHGGPSSGGFRGYLEPELAYWESDQTVSVGGNQVTTSTSDLLLGLNLIGAMPVNAVEFFLGGGIGIHFLDADASFSTSGISTNVDDSNEALGINAQFGIDIALGKNASLFALGRFDIIDDDTDELQGKASVGVRFLFGRD